MVLARFIPIVRTFLNPVAGALQMPARRFLLWNVIGALVWTEALLLAGHFLGRQLGAAFSIDKYVLLAVLAIVVLSLIPVAMEVRKARAGQPPGASPEPRREDASRHDPRGHGDSSA